MSFFGVFNSHKYNVLAKCDTFTVFVYLFRLCNCGIWFFKYPCFAIYYIASGNAIFNFIVLSCEKNIDFEDIRVKQQFSICMNRKEMISSKNIPSLRFQQRRKRQITSQKIKVFKNIFVLSNSFYGERNFFLCMKLRQAWESYMLTIPVYVLNFWIFEEAGTEATKWEMTSWSFNLILHGTLGLCLWQQWEWMNSTRWCHL